MQEKPKRFKRHTPHDPKIILQPRDYELIRAAYEYRILHADHLLALNIGFDAAHPRPLLKRLNKLFRNGYLDRPPQQLANYKLNQKIAYAVGDRGADVLAEHYGINRGKRTWHKKNYYVKDMHINHALKISDFRMAITSGIEKIPDAKLSFWKLSLVKELRDHVMVEGDPKPLPVNPDSFFGLYYGVKEKPKLFYFLEMDRGTMSHRWLFIKFKAYYYYWLTKKCADKYGIKSFRVLTVTKSEERADNLMKLSKTVDEGRGWPGFLFTHEKMYSFNDPQSVFKPIWKTPADKHLHHLLE